MTSGVVGEEAVRDVAVVDNKVVSDVGPIF